MTLNPVKGIKGITSNFKNASTLTRKEKKELKGSLALEKLITQEVRKGQELPG